MRKILTLLMLGSLLGVGRAETPTPSLTQTPTVTHTSTNTPNPNTPIPTNTPDLNTPTVTPTFKVVDLEGTIDNLEVNPYTIYRGNLDYDVSILASEFIRDGTFNLNDLLNSKTTRVVGYEMKGGTLESCLITEGLADSGSGLLINNIVVPYENNYPNAIDNFQPTYLKLDNNLIIGWDYGVNAISLGYYPEGHSILNNFVGFNHKGLIGSGDANIGDERKDGNNVFYKNQININGNLTETIKAEMNYWYDRDGNFLTDEQDILDTTNLGSSSKPNSTSIDVVPFHTDQPYGLGNTGVDNWEFY